MIWVHCISHINQRWPISTDIIWSSIICWLSLSITPWASVLFYLTLNSCNLIVCLLNLVNLGTAIATTENYSLLRQLLDQLVIIPCIIRTSINLEVILISLLPHLSMGCFIQFPSQIWVIKLLIRVWSLKFVYLLAHFRMSSWCSVCARFWTVDIR